MYSTQFSEQFKEVKEAARLMREKSQEKFELISPGLNIAPLQVFYPALDQNTSLYIHTYNVVSLIPSCHTVPKLIVNFI